jgi:anti-sigma factor RsiW
MTTLLHLTHEQLCELLLDDPSPREATSNVVQEHLHACILCTAELESLRSSLSLFRSASTSYANQQFERSSLRSRSIAPPQRYLSQPLYWAAAIVLLVAASFPLSLHWQHAQTPATIAISSPHATEAESDDALLEDVDRSLSANIPSPMESLADPTASVSAEDNTSNQRKN